MTTFCGSLDELVSVLRESQREGWIKLFPVIGRYYSFLGRSLKSCDEWNKFPDRRRQLLSQGKIEMLNFFDGQLSTLKRYLHVLYGGPNLKKAHDKLNRNLRKIKQYFDLSRRGEGEIEFANQDIVTAVKEFNGSLPPTLEKWKIVPENRKTLLGDEGGKDLFPLGIKRISVLIEYTKYRKGFPKIGQPAKPFNELLLVAVNRFTQRAYSADGSPIMKNGLYRVCKNWQLVCAALLWLHVYFGIPEMEAFIKKHGSEDANAALKNFATIAKRSYHNWRRGQRGMGKFAGEWADGVKLIDLDRLYWRDGHFWVQPSGELPDVRNQAPRSTRPKLSL